MKNIIKKSWPFLVLAVLAFIVHFVFLSHPAQVVFDEVHFGKFVGAYFTGKYYFDIHPPLGKLMIAGFAKLADVNPAFDFDHIGEAIPSNVLFSLRFLPAFFGAIFVLSIAWLAYLISRSKITALIAGFLILIDNAILVQSKFILVDIFLLFFEALTFCFFFLYQRQKTFSAKWFIYLILTGISFGLAISIKWTGLATIGIIGLVLLAKFFSKKLTGYLTGQSNSWSIDQLKKNLRQKLLESAADFIVIASLGFIIYTLPFAVHFNLLTKPGPGDAFMNWEFQQELKYGRANISPPLSFWQKFIELNKTMYKANAGITATHPYSSRWYGWPLDNKPVYYWHGSTPDNPNFASAAIYLIGNPLLWGLCTTIIIIFLFKLLTKKSRQNLSPAAYILLLGYFANLLPFIFIKRVAFLYHYLPSLVFAILLTSLFLTSLWPKKKLVLFSILGAILVVFLILTPLSYGISLVTRANIFELKIIGLLSCLSEGNETPRGKTARYLRNFPKPLTLLRQGFAEFSSPSS